MERYQEADILLSKSEWQQITHKGKIIAYCIDKELSKIIHEHLSKEPTNHPVIGNSYEVTGWSNGKKIKVIAIYDGKGYRSGHTYIPKQYAKLIKQADASKIKSKA